MILSALTCIGWSILQEGGLSTTEDDTGNWTGGAINSGELRGTKYGISTHAYPSLDIAGLSMTDAAAIYLRDYWPKVSGDALPLGLDLVVNDFGINSGPREAAMRLQGVLNITQDGDIGPVTLKAIGRGGNALIAQYTCSRVAFLKQAPGYAEFGAGWVARAERAQSMALALAS